MRWSMKTPEWMHANWFATLSLFVGGSALIMWVGWPIWELLKGHPRDASFCLQYIAFWVPFVPVLTIAGLWWGFRTLRGQAGRKKCLIRAIVPVLLLSPVLAVMGIFLAFAILPLFHNYFSPEQIEQSVKSPDERHVAKILKWDAGMDGIRRCYLRTDGGKWVNVGDTRDAYKIQWSPDSGIVIFEQQVDLLVVRTRDRKVYWIDLTYDRQIGQFLHFHPLDTIEFPRPGVFVTQFEDKTPSQTVDLAIGSRVLAFPADRALGRPWEGPRPWTWRVSCAPNSLCWISACRA